MTQTVKLTYFKDSGKYYSEGTFEVDQEKAMFHIFEIVKNLQRRKRLPDLVDGAAFNYIYVEAPGHPNNYPALIISENARVANES